MEKSSSSTKHIILIPRRDYWEWLDATREYALALQAVIAPYPENAVALHHQGDVLTVIVVPDGYPQHGDILEWLRRNLTISDFHAIHVQSPTQLRMHLFDESISVQPTQDGDVGSIGPIVSVEAETAETVRVPGGFALTS